MTNNPPVPGFGRIPDALRRSGLSRSTLYKLAAEHAGLFRKCGTATVVDFEMLDRVLAQLPFAKLSAPNATAA
jgi:hypothetical protein